MIWREQTKTLVKFAIVGVANTLVGLCSIYLCKWLLSFGDVLANACGYSLGLALSFFLNRRWTFRHSGPLIPSLLRFLLIFMLAYMSNLATVLALINAIGIDPYYAQAGGILPYTVIFFFGGRFVAFRPYSIRADLR
ncbi:MAG: hypothetical protein OJF51_003793 [Nitrospira sp.]|jgi:putative flippase GtrA|nr:MAG: hypothetical protein OJF51_003793 [Nitrospira sp.]